MLIRGRHDPGRDLGPPPAALLNHHVMAGSRSRDAVSGSDDH
jgi:hypothetical protein